MAEVDTNIPKRVKKTSNVLTKKELSRMNTKQLSENMSAEEFNSVQKQSEWNMIPPSFKCAYSESI